MYVGVPLHYKVYNDEMEFESKDNIFALDNPLNYPSISIGNQIFVYVPYRNSANKEGESSGYFELLNNI